MLMIAAAMEEELDVARALCRDVSRVPAENAKLWRGSRNGKTFLLLRTGIGPKKSAVRMEEALQLTKPDRILVIGYAGGLDPSLKLGNLVAVRKASAFSLAGSPPVWEMARIDEEFELSDWDLLAQSAVSAGLCGCTGNALSSAYVLGNPAHKRLLFENLRGEIVDMETAALARVASLNSVPISCIRSISDEAADTFLAPFSYDPAAGIPARARRLFENGMAETYREWRDHSSKAKESLARFLYSYL